MQVSFEQVEDKQLEGAVIRATEINKEIQNAIDLLEGNSDSIAGIKDGIKYLCKTSAIYYIESVDKRTYFYTKDECYETKYRLYELESMLGGYFTRCSKAMIINLRKLKNVKSDLGGRLEATLLNDEQVIISRGYVKEIKRRLDI